MRLRILSLLLFLLCSAFPLAAQFVPQGFNYQGIVRDDNGNPLANQSVSILFAIRSGAPNGPVSYSETQLTNTNEYGLVNVTIGQGGTPVQGTFNGINWGGSAKYLSIALETSPNVYDDLGTTQLLSVPYALYAQSAANGGGGGDDWGAQVVQTSTALTGNGTAGSPLGIAAQGAQPGQVLKWDGTQWIPQDDVSSTGSGGGTVTQINTGPGLTGGPITVNGTISLDNSGVVPGTYGSATQVPVITVDNTGRIMSANLVDISAGGSVTVLAGTGISVTQNGDEFTVVNTGDTDPTDDLTNISQAGGDVNGPFANLQLKAGVVGNTELADNAVNAAKIEDGSVGSAELADNSVTSAKIADGAVGNSDLADNAVGTSKIQDGAITAAKLDDMGAGSGQVLKWDGAAWVPADDNNSGGGSVNLTGGSGIQIMGTAPNFTIINTGDVSATDDITITSPSGGDVTGPFSNLQLKGDVITTLELADNAVETANIADAAVTSPKLADGAVTGTKIAQQGANNGQVLKWNGTAWVPGNDNTGGGGGAITLLPGVAIDIIDSGNNNFTISNAGDANPFDDVTLTSPAGGDVSGTFSNLQLNPFVVTNTELAANSVFTNNLIDDAVTGDKIAQQGATLGQVMKWTGFTWEPATDNVGVGDNWGTQTVSVNATLSGNGTAGNQLRLAQQGATNGQVLKWNGTTWVPMADNDTGDDWGTQSAEVAAALEGDGTVGSPLNIAQQGAANGQVLKWDGSAWTPADDIDTGDDWGAQSAEVGTALEGDGTVGSPLNIAQQGATNGQVLKWDGSAWTPADDIDTGDDWGAQSAQVAATLEGNGTVGSPLNIAQQGAANGQVLKWNGSSWAPANDIDTGDDWGAQSAVVASTLTGDGTGGSPLNIAQQGATNGQVLKWNGSSWTPADDIDTGDDWGAQSAVVAGTALEGNGTIGSPITLAEQGASAGQVLKWDGMNWVPSDDQGTGTLDMYSSGTGILITGTSPNFVINNAGDADADPVNELQTISLMGNTLELSNGGGMVVLPGSDMYNAGTGINVTGSAPNFTIENTGDLSNTNELQTLNLTGNMLEISSGNTVDLSGLAGSPDTYNAGTGINISGTSPNFTIENTGDLSNTNEIQVLSLMGGTLELSNGGGSVALPTGDNYTAGAGIDITGTAPNFTIVNTGDADADPANELQSISLVGNTLELSDGGGMVVLPSGNTYNAGTGIDITGTAPNFTIENIGDADADPTNELQTLTLTGTDLEISGGNTIDLSGLGGSSLFWTAAGDDIFSNNTGAVMIGTNAGPEGKLHVEADAGTGMYLTAPAGPALLVEEGQVGLGTLTPATALHIKSMAEMVRLEGSNARMTLTPGGSMPSVTGGYVSITDSTYVISSKGDVFDLELRANELPSIFASAASGNVGIGAANDGDAALKVYQTSGGLQIENTSNDHNWEFQVDDFAGSLALYNDQNGLVPAGVFAPNGIYTPSDLRLKKDIEEITSVKDRLLQLKPITYHLKHQKGNEQTSIGFVAQDVEAMFPDLVQGMQTRDGKVFLSVNYTGISVLAVRALQEQQTEIDALAKENEQLRKQFESLDARIKALEAQK